MSLKSLALLKALGVGGYEGLRAPAVKAVRDCLEACHTDIFYLSQTVDLLREQLAEAKDRYKEKAGEVIELRAQVQNLQMGCIIQRKQIEGKELIDKTVNFQTEPSIPPAWGPGAKRDFGKCPPVSTQKRLTQELTDRIKGRE